MATTVIGKLEIDVTQVLLNLKKIVDQSIKTGTDTAKAFAASAAGLADSFNAAAGGAAIALNTQRNALAALTAAGKTGSDEYARLLQETKAVVAEQKKLDAALSEVDAAIGNISKRDNPLGGVFQFNQFAQAANTAAQSLNSVISVGSQFESSLAAVGAITGQSGAALDALGTRARELAVAFGGSATDQLASFQGILSKLGPQVADTPAALGKLAENVNTLSAASGDAAATSMSAIVDSMLQFGLVTGDATIDAETSTRIINGLAASAQVGAAEIPQVAQAILQAGVAAKGANLSFESTNAAIQALAVGGKTGSEAGVALRNVLGLLQKASGPAATTMQKLGTSTAELGQILTTQGLGPALEKLKAGMDGLGSAAERNAALMTIFGTENSAAAGILLDNVGLMAEFEAGIIAGQQGVGAAFEQAAVRMDTTSTKIAQAKAFIEDQFITMFDAVGGGVSAVLGTIAEMGPTLTGLVGIKEIIPQGAFDKAQSALKSYTASLFAVDAAGKRSFVGVGAAVAQLGGGVKNAAISILRTLVPSLFTTATAQTAVAGTSAAATAGLGATSVAAGTGAVAFTGFWSAATLGAPIVIAGLAAVGAGIVYLLSQMEPVQRAFDAIVAGVKAGFEAVKSFIGSVGSTISSLLSGDLTGAWDSFSNAAGDAADAAAASILNSQIESAIETIQAKADEGVKIKARIEEAEGVPALVDKLNTLRDQIGTLQIKVDAGSATAEEIAKLDQLKKAAADASAQIVKIAPDSKTGVEVLKTSTGEYIEVLTVATDKAKELAASQVTEGNAKLVQTQQQFTAELNAGLALQSQQQQRVAALAEEYQKLANTPGSEAAAARVKEQLTEAQKQAAETGTKINELITTGAKAGTIQFDKVTVPDNMKSELQSRIDVLAKEAADNAKAQELKIVTNNVIKVSQQIEGQDEIAGLVEKFKAAKSEAEKNSIAEAISRRMPEAVQAINKGVDAEGNLIREYQLSTDQIEKNIAANKQRLGGDLQQKQAAFFQQLQKEGAAYQANRAELLSLAEQMSRTTDPKRLAELQARFNKLRGEVKGGKDRVIEMGREAIKFGTDGSSAAQKVAASLGLTKEEAAALTQELAGTNAELSKSPVSAQDLAAANAERNKGIQESYELSTAALRELENERIAAEARGDKAAAAAASKRIKELQAQQKQAFSEQQRQQGITEKYDLEAQVKRAQQQAEALRREREKAAEELVKITEKRADQEARLEELKQADASAAKIQKQERENKKTLEGIDKLISETNTRLGRVRDTGLRDTLQRQVEELTKQRVAAEEAGNILVANIRREEERKVARETLRAGIESIKAQVEAATATTADGFRLRQQLQLALLEEEKQLALLEAEDSQEKQLALEQQFAVKRRELILASERDIAEALTQERINQIDDAAERELQTRLAEAERVYAAELEKAEGNERRQFELFEQYLNARTEARRRFDDEQAGAFGRTLSTTLQQLGSAFDGFTVPVNTEGGDDTRKEIEEIGRAQARLREEQARGSKTYQEAVAEEAALQERLRAAQSAQADEQSRFWSAYRDAAVTALRKVSDTFAETMREQTKMFFAETDAIEKRQRERAELQQELTTAEDSDRDAIQKKIDDTEAAIAKSTTARQEAIQQAYEATAASATASFVALALASENIANAIATTALDALQSIVPVLTAQIFGQAFAQLGPIGGAVAFASVNAIFQGFIAAAKAGFREGGYTGDGAVHEAAGIVHKREFVHTAETTAKHRRLFEHIHRGGDPLQYLLSAHGIGTTPNAVDEAVQQRARVYATHATRQLQEQDVRQQRKISDGTLRMAVVGEAMSAAPARATREDDRLSSIESQLDRLAGLMEEGNQITEYHTRRVAGAIRDQQLSATVRGDKLTIAQKESARKRRGA